MLNAGSACDPDALVASVEQAPLTAAGALPRAMLVFGRGRGVLQLLSRQIVSFPEHP
jgi:hypothetical protein